MDPSNLYIDNDLRNSSKKIKHQCLICKSTRNVRAIRRISLPARTVILRTDEPRCSEHVKFLECSFCQKYYDPLKVKQVSTTQRKFPSNLCGQHINQSRCQSCGKWTKSGNSKCFNCYLLSGTCFSSSNKTQFLKRNKSPRTDLRISTLKKMAYRAGQRNNCANQVGEMGISIRRSPAMIQLCSLETSTMVN